LLHHFKDSSYRWNKYDFKGAKMIRADTPRETEPVVTEVSKKGLFSGITKNVYATGLVSLFTDISSEMIYPLVPLFLANVLGAPKSIIGLIEGIAESTASLLKIISGWLSDWAQKRKPLMLMGYSLSNIVKPLLALTNNWTQVLLIRFTDRIGKGIRGAPRDALIADSTASNIRGKAFGLHRAMDTLGAAIGPVAAFLLLSTFHEQYRIVFLLSAVPGILSLVILIFWVTEAKYKKTTQTKRPKLGLVQLGPHFLVFLALTVIFTLGNSTDAFLILRAQNLGMSVSLIPLAYFTFNIVYSLAATPAGLWSDQIGRRSVLFYGYLLFSLIYLGFALAGTVLWIWILFTAYGFYYAMTEGIAKALITDLVPAHLRATAIGTFSFTTGIITLPASLIGGFLWEYISPAATFYFGAAMTFMAAILLKIWLKFSKDLGR
jgi:MFS family permease